MKKTLLLALTGLYSFTIFAQTIQYAQDPIPFKEANDDQLQLVGSEGFTHAWVYNNDKLSLTVYNKELRQVAKHNLYSKEGISGAPYFQLSFPSYYYVVLPLKGTNNIYKIFPDGTSQEVEEPNRPPSSPPG